MSSYLHIEDNDLSRAWARAFLGVMHAPGKEVSPLVVTITDFTDGYPKENDTVRQLLDTALTQAQQRSCQTVASTIFPRSLWNPERDRAELFERYISIAPSLRKHKGNSYGIYFERLIAFGPNKINQLEHIIRTRNAGNHRRSALQASLFDPASDHTGQRQRGFPCLQQVAFAPYGEYGLVVTGFYATQYLFERAYGNYLGLCDLGCFVAKELGLQLTQLNCMANIALPGKPNKAAYDVLMPELQQIIESE